MFDDLNVGLAKNLQDPKAPPTNRKFGHDTACGEISISDEGRGAIKMMYGATYVANQLVPDETGEYDIPLTNNGTYLFRDGDGNESLLTGTSSMHSKHVIGGVDKLIDLSLWFGPFQQPSTIAGFYKRFPTWKEADIPYNKGTFVTYRGIGVKTVGFNCYNHATGTAELIGGNRYQICGTYTSVSYTDMWGHSEDIIPDSDGIFTPASNGTLAVNGGNDTDTCVHLCWSGYKNFGEPDYKWEPYTVNTKPLDITRYFPFGMNGLFGMYDTLTPTEAVQRFGVKICDGSEAWSDNAWPNGAFLGFSDMPVSYYNQCGAVNFFHTYRPNMSYTYTPAVSFGNHNRTFAVSAINLVIGSSSIEDWKNWLAARYAEGHPFVIIYPLEYPIVTTFETPLNLTYPVNDFGTEQSLPVNTTTLLSTDLNADIQYSIDFTRTVQHYSEIEKDVKGLVKEKDNLARQDGYYAKKKLGAYSAEQLIDPNAAPNDAKFGFRTAAGDVSITDGTGTVHTQYGTTEVVNQIVAPTNVNTVQGNAVVQVTDAVAGATKDMVLTAPKSVVLNQQATATQDTVVTGTGVVTTEHAAQANANALTITAPRSVVVNQRVSGVHGNLAIVTGTGAHSWSVKANATAGTDFRFVYTGSSSTPLISDHILLYKCVLQSELPWTVKLGNNATHDRGTWQYTLSDSNPVTCSCVIHGVTTLVTTTFNRSGQAVGDILNVSDVQLVDLTQYFNGNTTLINSITSWDDLVAYDPRFANYVPYNTGTVSGVTPSVKVTGKNLMPYADREAFVAVAEKIDNFYSGITFHNLPVDVDFTMSLYNHVDVPDSDTRMFLNGATSPFVRFRRGVGTKSVTAKPDSNGTLVVAINTNALNTSTLELTQFQLELGSEATAYEAYHDGGTAQSPEPLFAVGDAADTYEVVSGTLNGRIKAYTFTGNETWRAYGTTGYCFAWNTGDKMPGNTNVMMADYINPGGLVAALTMDKVVAGYHTNNDQNVYILDSAYNTSDIPAFAAHMTGKTIYYELATPTTTSGTPTQISLQSGSNIALQTDSGRSVTLALDYPATVYDKAILANRTYLHKHGSAVTKITGQSTVQLEGTDQLVDLTQLFNNDTTAIAAVSAWNDLVAAVPAYAATMAYNAGVVTGAVPAVKVSGKNLFDKNNLSAYRYVGETTTVDGRTCIDIKGLNDPNDTNPSGQKRLIFYFAKPTVCQITFQSNVASGNGYLVVSCHYTDGTMANVLGGPQTTGWSTKSVGSNPSKLVSCLVVNNGLANGYSYLDIDTIQLELGSEATAYEPYFDGGTITAPSTMYGVGSVADTFDALAGKTGRKIGSYTFTGEEPWAAYTNFDATHTFQWLALPGKANGFTNLILPGYIPLGGVQTVAGTDMSTCGYSQAAWLFITDYRFNNTDVASFASYIAGKTIYYELATPTEESSEAKPTSFQDGVNVISQSSSDIPGVGISADYDGTHYNLKLINNCKYIVIENGVTSYLTASNSNNSPAVVGGSTQVINLTQWFGKGYEPASVAAFYARYPSLKGYAMPYIQGQPINYKGTGIRTVGFNCYNPATGTAVLLGGNEYQICGAYTDVSYTDRWGNEETLELDEDGIFTPVNDGTLTVTGGNATDTCVHLTWSGYKNYGKPEYQWEPYWQATSPLHVLTYFPAGMNGLKYKSGNVEYEIRDELTTTGYTNKFTRITLDGTENWSTYSSSSYKGFCISNFFSKATSRLPVICRYGITTSVDYGHNLLNIWAGTGNMYLYVTWYPGNGTTDFASKNGFIKNGNLDVAAFKAWLAAEPLEIIIRNPDAEEVVLPSEVRTDFQVSDFGTEELLPADASGIPTSTLLDGKIQYVEDFLRLILNYSKIYSVVKNLADAASHIAFDDGTYPNMITGNSYNLIDREAQGTAREFSFDTVNGTNDVTDGTAIAQSVYGQTLMANQLVQDNISKPASGTSSVSVDDAVAGDVASLVVEGRSLVKNQLVPPTMTNTKASANGTVNVTDAVAGNAVGLTMTAPRSVVKNQLVPAYAAKTASGSGVAQVSDAIADNALSLKMTAPRSVVLNQLVENGNFSDEEGSYWKSSQETTTISKSNNIVTISTTGTDQFGVTRSSGHILNCIVGHKYLFAFRYRINSAGASHIGVNITQGVAKNFTGTVGAWTFDSVVGTATTAQGWNQITLSGTIASGDSFDMSNMMLVDLTQYFNNNTTLINSITSWADLVAYDPRFASYVLYNTGTVTGVTPTVTVTGKNLMNDGTVSITDAASTLRTLPAALPPGTYTLSANITTSAETDHVVFTCYDANNAIVDSTQSIALGGASTTFTTTKVVTSIRLYSAQSASDGVGQTATWANVQLERGNTATTYEAYHAGGSVTAPEELFGLWDPNTKIVAKDVHDAVSGVTTRIVKSYTFTGNENFAQYDASSGRYIYQYSFSDRVLGYNVLMAEYITHIGGLGEWTNEYEIHAGIGSKFVYFGGHGYHDLTSFKAWIAGKTIYYELEAPTTSTDQTNTIALQEGNNMALQTDGGRTATVELGYNGIEQQIPLNASRAYICRINGVSSRVTDGTTQSVVGGRDMIVDLTQYYNNNSTLIASIQTWADLVLYDPSYAAYVTYNAGTVTGVRPQVTVTNRSGLSAKQLAPRDVVMNQQINYAFFGAANNWGYANCSSSVSNGENTITVTSTDNLPMISSSFGRNPVAGHISHVYMMCLDVKPSVNTSVIISGYRSNPALFTFRSSSQAASAGTWTRIETKSSASANFDMMYIHFGALAIDDTVVMRNFMLVDLTTYFNGDQELINSITSWDDLVAYDSAFAQYVAYDTGTTKHLDPYGASSYASPVELFGDGTNGDSYNTVAGTFTSRFVHCKISDLTWTRHTNTQDINYFRCSNGTVDTNGYMYAERYLKSPAVGVSNMSDKSINGSTTSNLVLIRDDSYTTVEDWLAAVGDSYIVYTRVEPNINDSYTASDAPLTQGTNNLVQTDGGRTIPFTLDYTGTEFTLPLDSTHKYAFSDNGVKSIITGSSEQAVTGGQDMLVDVTRMFNGVSADIAAITSWADMAAVMPAYLSNVAYNEGEVVARGGTITTAVWNQLINSSSLSGWNERSCTATVSERTYNIVSQSSGWGHRGLYKTITNAKSKYYYVRCNLRTISAARAVLEVQTSAYSGVTLGSNSTTTFQPVSAIIHGSYVYLGLCAGIAGETVGTAEFSDVMFIDLTAIYGAGHEPSTVAEFEADCAKWGKDLTQYQAYDAGTPMGGSATFTGLHGVGNVVETQNIITGERNTRFGSIDLGTLTWNYSSYWYSSGIANSVKRPTSSNQSVAIISTKYNVRTANGLAAGGIAIASSGSIYVTNGSTTETPTGTLVYELAESIPSQETPQPLTVANGPNIVHEADMSITGASLAMTYTGTDQTLVTDTSRKYLQRINGVDEVVENVASIDVVGVRDRVIDLTYMFGAGREPATAASFYKLFPTWRGYAIPYNKGSRVNFKGTGLKSVGFNQWDGSIDATSCYLKDDGTWGPGSAYAVSGYIRAVPGQVYRITAGQFGAVQWYTYDKTFISGTPNSGGSSFHEFTATAPANAYWFRFTIHIPNETRTCVYFQWSGGRNGDYEPYWEFTRQLPTLTYFPEGMNGRGTVQDEITSRQAIKRLAEVKMEDLEWTWNSSGVYGYWSTTGLASSIKKVASNSDLANIVGENGLHAVTNGQINGSEERKNTIAVNTNGGVLVNNGSSTESPTGKLVYELATPVTVTFPEEEATTAQVSDYGTESLVPVNGHELVTAPFLGIVKYQDNYARAITKLPKNYQSQESMDNLQLVLNNLLNVTLTSVYDEEHRVYDYTVTGDGVPGLIAAALTALAPVTGLTFLGNSYAPTNGIVALPDPNIKNVTTIPATTSNYTLGEGNYDHAPNSVPTYILPTVEDATIVHRTRVTVKMSSTVLSANFKDNANIVVIPEAFEGTVRSGTLVEYNCHYEPLVAQWVVTPRVVTQTEPPPDEIWYTADSQVTLYSQTGVESHTFENGKGVVKFTSNVTTVPHVLRNTAVKQVAVPGTVTAFAADALRSCTSLKKVNIPVGLTTINASAFYQCSNLELDELVDTITTIGNSAFYSCSKITLSKLPSALTSLGSDAFRNCTLITVSEIPIGVTAINANVFNACKGITALTLHDNITSIGGWAFDGCSNLTITELPANLRKIYTYAFSNCTSLALTSLPSGVDLIESRAFSGCKNLALTSLPDGVTDLGNANAFYECNKLALTELPPNLTRVATNTFYRCYAIKIKVIPASVETLETQCFRECTGLTELTFKGTPTTIDSNFLQGCTNITSIKVPWAEGAVAGAPWGATNATITYNYTE